MNNHSLNYTARSVERDYRHLPSSSIELARYRAEQIEVVLAELLAIGKLEEQNLRGRVVDVGTGYGPGVLAIQEFGPKSVVGVDAISHPFGYDPKVVIGHRFVHGDARDFLARHEGDLDLITVFNNGRLANIESQAMAKLKVGGQFLVTSDSLMLPGVAKYMSVYRWLKSEEGKGWCEFDRPNYSDDFYYVSTKV